MELSVLLKVLIVLAAIFGTHGAKKSRHERQVPSPLFSGSGTGQGLGGYQQSFGGHLSHHVLGGSGGSFGVFQSGHGGIPGQFTGQVDVLHGPLSHASHFEGGFGSAGGFGTTGSFGEAQIHRAAAEHHHLSRKAQSHTQIAHAAMAQAEAVQNAQLQAAATEKHLIRKAMAHHTAAQQAQTAANSAQQRLLHASATRQALLQASASRAAAISSQPLGVRQGLFGGHYGTGGLYSKSGHGIVGQYGGLGFHGAGAWKGAAGYGGTVPWHGSLTHHGAGPWYGRNGIHDTGTWYDTTRIHGTGTLGNRAGIHGTGTWYDTTSIHGTGTLDNRAGNHGLGTLFGGTAVQGTGIFYGGTDIHGAGLMLPGSVRMPSSGLSHAGQHISGLDLQTTRYSRGGLYGEGTYVGGTGVTPLVVSHGITIPGRGFQANYGAVGVGFGHQVGGIPHGHTVSKIKKCTSIHAVHNVRSGLQQYEPVEEDLQSGIIGGGHHQLYGGGLVSPHISQSFVPPMANSFAPQTSLGYGYSAGDAASGLHRGFEALRTPVGLEQTLTTAH